MRYQKIKTQIWTDEKFINLSDDAKFLFFYCMTNPHTNSIGLYVIKKEYICVDLKWSKQRVSKRLEELFQNGLVTLDETVNLMLINNHLKHDHIQNENQAKGAINTLETLPKSPLFTVVLDYLEDKIPKPFQNRFDTLKKQSRNQQQQQQAVTYTETDTDSVNMGNTSHNSNKTKTKPKNEIKNFLNEPELKKAFDSIVKVYPKKNDLKRAYQEFKKIILNSNGSVNQKLVSEIIEKIKQQKDHSEWKEENGKYIPLLVTYLHNQRWKDEGIIKPEVHEILDREYYNQFVNDPENKKKIEEGKIVVKYTGD